MYLGPLAPALGRSASWPSEVTGDDVAWLDAQWVLAGGRPAPEPLTAEDRAQLARYLTWDPSWVTTTTVRG